MLGCLASIHKITDHGYSSSKDFWLYRTYNGDLVSKGSKVGSVSVKAIKGSTIRFDLDHSALKLAVFANGASVGAISGMTADVIYPAIATYGTSCSVEALSCSSDSVPSPTVTVTRVTFADVSSGVRTDDTGKIVTSSDGGRNHAILSEGRFETGFFVQGNIVRLNFDHYTHTGVLTINGES